MLSEDLLNTRHRAGLVGVGLSGQQARHIPCLPMAGHLFDGYVH